MDDDGVVARPADRQVWDSVAWWYQNLAQFTLDWELPHLDPAALQASPVFSEQLLEGVVVQRRLC